MPLSSNGLCDALMTMPADSRRQARFQRGFEQVARDAGVLADQHGRTLAPRAIRIRQRASCRPAELEDEVRGDRRIADASAHPVGSEVAALSCGGIVH